MEASDLVDFQSLAQHSLVFFWLLVFILASFIFVFYGFGYWLFHGRQSTSPYMGASLVYGHEMSFEAVQKVENFLKAHEDKNNPSFTFNQASICKLSGRIFPNSLGFSQAKRVDWSFLSRRHPGSYISWGSLSEQERQQLYQQDPQAFQGYQYQASSKKSKPSKAELYFQALKPGPLYIDVNQKLLMGWMCVPDTELEVLIVKQLSSNKGSYD